MKKIGGTMKRTITVILCFVIFFLFVGCGKGDVSQVKIDYGTSSTYSKEEMDSAIDVIKKQFLLFDVKKEMYHK